MGFKLSSISGFNYSTPQNMYADYKNRNINSPYDYQSKILDSYMESGFEEPDVSLELPTGSGKTLVGLLIGEFRRRKNREKVVYLCANNLLVNQTSKNAIEQYGINARAFTGKKTKYSATDKDCYHAGSCIAVTTYSALFNCNPFFNDADLLIFDDAHSAEEYIISNWSITIKEDDEPFFELVDSLKPILSPSTYHRLVSGYQSLADRQWVDMIPNSRLSEVADSISSALETHLADNPESNLRFPWGMIKRHLPNCSLYISQTEICIRPFIPPTMLFPPFANAKQRLYMSATLGRSGELERTFGIERITDLPMLDEWKNKTTGRRFFLFPLSSFGDTPKEDLLMEIVAKANRSLIMVNSDRSQKSCEETIRAQSDKNVFFAKELENDKTCFTSNDDAVAVVANRLDGIDFPNDECRLEVILDLPTTTHLQEQFFIKTVAARPLYSERIRSRLTQAFGRCTRSQTDYSVVCILGEGLTNTAISPKEMEHLNPELQAELQFGHDNAKDLTSLEEYLSLVDIFLYNRADWQDAENNILQLRNTITQGHTSSDTTMYDQLRESSIHEVSASYAIWAGDYRTALEEIDKVLASMNHDELSGYIAYWHYSAVNCIDLLLREDNDHQYDVKRAHHLKEAKAATRYSSWLSGVDQSTTYNDESLEDGSVIRRIEERISSEVARASSRKSIIDKLDNLVEALGVSKGTDFEDIHCELGSWLGYVSTNPKGDAEPDPIWIVNQDLCVVAEDKIYERTDKSIPVRHVREAAGHSNWIKLKAEQNLLDLSPNIDPIVVFITNTNEIEENAQVQAEDIFYLSLDTFLVWAKEAVAVLKNAVETFIEVGDAAWRNQLCLSLHNKGVSTNGYIALVKKTKLKDL